MVHALLSDEQQMLREMATSLASSVEVHNPADLAAVDRAKGWRSLADAGLLGLRVRDSSGVPTSSGVEVMVVAEALGGALAPLPYLGNAVLASELLALAGAPETWQQAIADGSQRYAVLLTPDLSDLATVSGLSGAIAADCVEATYGLALSDGNGTPHVMRVPLGTDAENGSADLTRDFARLSGEAANPTAAGAPMTADQLARWRALALTAVSADLLGAMRTALNEVVAYSKERIAYGVPVGSFQAIQHMCADALVRCEAAASCISYAAWAVDELNPAEALLAARTAKAYAGAAGPEVAETVMQVYGGIGQTWEHVAHLYTRRVLLDGQLLGAPDDNLLGIADQRLGAQ